VHLELTDEQAALRDSVREVLDDLAPLAVARAVHEKGDPGVDLWGRLVDLGWPALTVAEDAGGLGLGPVELALVCEELGRHAAPTPFLATAALYLPAVRGTTLVAEVVAGTTGTLAVADAPDRWDATTATAAADLLTATKHQVLDGASADRVAVAVTAPDGSAAVAVCDRAAVTADAVPTSDPTRPWATVSLSTADVVETVAVDLPRVLAEGTVALAADVVGACSAAFDLTKSHVSAREQFGAPVGSFQAVKHKLVDCFVAIERARAAVWFAALALAEDDPRWREATHMAKAAAGDCARLVAQEAIQLHGGIGYTWEHDVHLLVKRAKSGEVMLGTAGWHRQQLAALLLT
jgi:alkylation response protein AidB-like acyl-CoA dehydrogenase